MNHKVKIMKGNSVGDSALKMNICVPRKQWQFPSLLTISCYVFFCFFSLSLFLSLFCVSQLLRLTTIRSAVKLNKTVEAGGGGGGRDKKRSAATVK